MRKAVWALFFLSTPVFAGQNVLTWEDRSTNETQFHIERKAEQCAGPGAFAEVATVGANVQTYTDTQVTEGQFYCYRVAAGNGTAKSAYSNLAGRTVPFTVPATPANLQVQ